MYSVDINRYDEEELQQSKTFTIRFANVKV